MSDSNAQSTHFGDRTVNAKDKQGLVDDVFHKVAARYDIMNDLMSGGMHRLWKEEMVSHLPRYKHTRLLDLAGGTGDISFRYLQKLREGQGADVTICDINPSMLGEGKRRAMDGNYSQHITWVCGNAEDLPMQDNDYDAATIAFGIRNVTHIDTALQEIYRVLKPGGMFLCLEFSPVGQESEPKPLDPFAKVYNLYSDTVIPKMGKMVTGDAQPYEYLVQSIRKFPSPQVFAEKMRAAGFTRVTHRPMTHGVVSLHKGWKV